MIQDATAPLRRVYVRAPAVEDLAHWSDYGWHVPPDTAAAVDEHEAFRTVLQEAGAEIVLARAATTGDPDAIYTYDPLLLIDDGVVVLRPGKEGRRSEPRATAQDLAAAGLEVVGTLTDPATAEGGDMFFLDRHTLLVGVGYRTNGPAVHQLTALMATHGIDVHAFDLPHLHGPDTCLHLMSLISPLAPDLAVVYLPLMPVRLVQLLADRGVELVEVPEDEFATMGPNVLALGPRRALALEGNPGTRARMEAAGVEVRTYRGEQISLNGDGGPTCLTRPLVRG